VYICTNGTQVPIGPAYPNFPQAQALSTVDEANGVLYFVGYNLQTSIPEFIGLSLADGSMVSNVPVPFAEAGFIGVGQYCAWEPKSQRMIVGGQDKAGNHMFGTIDPVAGDWNSVANMSSKFIDVLGGDSVFVPGIGAAGSYFFQLGTTDAIDVYRLDMATGNITDFKMSQGSNIVTLDWDPRSNMLVGLGIGVNSTGDLVRTVANMDPNTGAVTTVGIVPGYVIESGGEAAFDAASGGLFWIGESTAGTPGASPFYLVQVSIADASVLSVSITPLCAQDATCPWQIQYLNAPPSP